MAVHGRGGEFVYISFPFEKRGKKVHKEREIVEEKEKERKKRGGENRGG